MSVLASLVSPVRPPATPRPRRGVPARGRGPAPVPVVGTQPRHRITANGQPPDAPNISVVVPAYNEADRLAGSLPRMLDDGHLRPGSTTELIVVDDGSHDETAAVARRHLPDIEQARVLRLPWHAGKGAAVRLGVSAARGQAIMFMDADLATNLAVVPKALDLLADTDVVVGSRSTPRRGGPRPVDAASDDAPRFRRHARRLTGIEVSDPQCGLKAFHADVAKILFHLSRTDGFGFDVEILLLAAQTRLSGQGGPGRLDRCRRQQSSRRARPRRMALDITRARLRHGRRPADYADDNR